MADWFLVGDDFAFLVDIVTEWLAYGIGLGAIVWVISCAVGLIWQFVKF